VPIDYNAPMGSGKPTRLPFEESRFDPAIESLLVSIRKAILAVAGSSLVGLYLFGSLTDGDFDAAVSDVDLIAVLADGPSEWLVVRLGRMHEDLARAHPDWDDRIEVIYIARQGLVNCRTSTTTIGVISPGEPFHVVEAGRDWILNWYPARENGVRLIGPPIESLIPPIQSGEYIEEVRRSLVASATRIADDAPPGGQAYAILTMCRGLYAIRFGERLSKAAAASWAQQEFPQWAGLIRQALRWRQRQRDPDGQDGAATVSETLSFVTAMAELAIGSSHALPARLPRGER
jgi:predicted nucleotidyltransferase